MDNKNIAVIILSGGNSSRMGHPKAFLKKNHTPLIKLLSDIYIDSGIKKPVIVLNGKLYNEEWKDDIKVLSLSNTLVKNNFPEAGRSFSLQLGLKELRNTSGCFIQNVDNPDISIGLLKEMKSKLSTDNYVVAANNYICGHPVLLSSAVLERLKKLEDCNWILRNELKNFSKTLVNTSTNNVLLNLNTKEDWRNYTEN